MSHPKKYYLGIDCGATTSKVGGIDVNGEPISRVLQQSATPAEQGPAAIISGWMNGVQGFMESHRLSWEDVAGVGLAIPGPYQAYGVLDRQPNLPESLTGWHFLQDLTEAVSAAAGRTLSVVTANDGQLAGMGEAEIVQKQCPGSVIMLSPGTGLGGAYVQADGTLLEGDHRAAAILGHMPIPYEKLGLPAFVCGCGRDWGCGEAYTSISGLPQLIRWMLKDFPEHPLNRVASIGKKEALSLRGLAQEGDELALAVFDKQAQALGYVTAIALMAFDATHVVIGGGLTDPEATTESFRGRYLNRIIAAAKEFSWVSVEQLHFHFASLGELAQAIGAAKLAR